MKVVAIVAARMGSARLPGKVLRTILGVPMLGRMIERLSRCKKINEIVVATSVTPQDQMICDYVEKSGHIVERGAEEDVLGRYADVAGRRRAEAVVRLTGDCPLIDPEVTDKVIETHLVSADNDLTTNVLERTFPRGFDTEVLSISCLQRLDREMKDPLYREHITNYVYDYPERFKIENVRGEGNFSNLRLCVDTKEDFELVNLIFESLYLRNPDFGFQDILTLMQEKPQLKEINRATEQAKIFKKRKNP